MAAKAPPPGGVDMTPDKNVSYCFAAALAYGIYLSTLAFTVRWLLFADEGWKRRQNIKWSMVAVTLFIFLATTAYTALDVVGSEDAIRLIMAQPGAEYNSPMWMNITKCFFANSIALAADVVLIYRCYMVYGSSIRIIIFPVILWIGGFVCTILQMYLQIMHQNHPNLGPYKWASVNMKIGPGIVLLPFWGSTAVLNLYCTVVIIWRIYQVAKQSETSTSVKQFQFIVRSIAESGFIYLSITIAHFVVWFTYDNLSLQIISALNVPLIGIAFNLILIRAAHSRLEQYNTEKTSSEGMTSIGFSTDPSFTVGYGSQAERKGFDLDSRMTEP